MDDVPQGVEKQQPVQVDIPLRRSDRVRRQPERYSFLLSDHDDVMLIEDEPTTFQEAVMRPDSEKWLEAMRSEMESMYTNQVWTLVDPPEGVNPLGVSGSLRERLTWMDLSIRVAW